MEAEETSPTLAAAGFGHINGRKMLLVEAGARYKVFDTETRSQGVNIAGVGGGKAVFMGSNSYLYSSFLLEWELQSHTGMFGSHSLKKGERERKSQMCSGS